MSKPLFGVYLDIPRTFDMDKFREAFAREGLPGRVAWEHGSGRRGIKISTIQGQAERSQAFACGWMACLRAMT